MFKMKETIEVSNVSSSEYIIKDKNGITVGRINVIDFNRNYKSCLIRIKYYRSDNILLLKECINSVCIKFFNIKDLFKLSIIIDDDLNITPFGELGFKLEGILENNISENGIYTSKYLFGITSIQFNSRTIHSCLNIEGKNITLKLLTPEHTNDILAYYIKNKVHLENFEPLRDSSFYTEKVQKKILSENYRQYLNGTSMNLGIFKNDILIGKIQLSNIVYGIFKNAFIGYSIDKDEQGKGYMKDAVNTLVNYAFREMELHRIEASTLTDNFKSQNVLTACGFMKLGINKNYLNINGQWRDHVSFYKTK